MYPSGRVMAAEPGGAYLSAFTELHVPSHRNTSSKMCPVSVAPLRTVTDCGCPPPARLACPLSSAPKPGGKGC